MKCMHLFIFNYFNMSACVSISMYLPHFRRIICMYLNSVVVGQNLHTLNAMHAQTEMQYMAIICTHECTYTYIQYMQINTASNTCT
jgi:hypothetical protein